MNDKYSEFTGVEISLHIEILLYTILHHFTSAGEEEQGRKHQDKNAIRSVLFNPFLETRKCVSMRVFA